LFSACRGTVSLPDVPVSLGRYTIAGPAVFERGQS
jgi:hypothetical protein